MSLTSSSPDKHRGKTKSFWSGSHLGSIGAEVRAKQDQAALQCRMGRERIKAQYEAMKASRPP